MAHTLVLISGGLDSATALATLVGDGDEIAGLFIDYGQEAVSEEGQAAAAVASHYDIPIRRLKLSGGHHFGAGEIRGRNSFLLHSALLVAPAGPVVVTIAVHGGVPYVDCQPEWLGLHVQSFALQTGGEAQISAPFLSFSKADVFALAQDLSVPVAKTYSCERAGGPCGSCLSCLDREALDALA